MAFEILPFRQGPDFSTPPFTISALSSPLRRFRCSGQPPSSSRTYGVKCSLPWGRKLLRDRDLLQANELPAQSSVGKEYQRGQVRHSQGANHLENPGTEQQWTTQEGQHQAFPQPPPRRLPADFRGGNGPESYRPVSICLVQPSNSTTWKKLFFLIFTTFFCFSTCPLPCWGTYILRVLGDGHATDPSAVPQKSKATPRLHFLLFFSFILF